MKKWIIIGSIAALVLVSVSVFALQGKAPQAQVPQEVAPKAASASYSGCGAGGSGCGASAGCGGAGGGCGAEALSPEEASARVGQIQAYLTDYFEKKKGLSGVTVKVDDFGCHQEATVLKDGQVVAKFSISGRNVTPVKG